MRRRPTRRWRPGLALVLALVLALAGWLWWRTDTAPPVALVTAPVTIGDVETSVLATGLLKPTSLVAIGAQVSGRVETLAVAMGDRVKAGDLIAEIDPVPRQNALRIARANLAEVEAERDEANATLGQQQRLLERRRGMAGAGVTQSDVDAAEADVAITEARIAALGARIESAKVAVEDAEVDLGYTRITAPQDGTILAVVTQQGQTVNATQTTPTIVVMGELATMSIEAGISEADVVHVHPGQEVWFTILGEPDVRHAASLTAIAPAPTSITSDTLLTGSSSAAVSTTSSEAIYYNGVFSVPNPDGRLRTYMTAEVHVVLDRATAVPTIPSAALAARTPDGRASVSVARADGTTESRDVEVGLDDRTTAEIRSGLTEGERVVLGSGSDGTGGAPGMSRRMRPPMGF
ncbi:macrolide-specific efflux system membrane fusion protein [Amaricoccus macauensis]|uniref:Macrolide-specific efflux system membrane fusion protein n=1 Tax=Amaricoccus macauensis TaxID=57001 RepID=A0A840SJM8_9RHOB|nr:efflux RND transporter periplasmic adaptor subunit [Amaricoccus macauensis]MBB5223319.1 macrolide-specific efflux system membrane fusion protein [Amaricoccus macauensis]